MSYSTRDAITVRVLLFSTFFGSINYFDYSRAIEVTTVNNPGNRWDTQFFIRLPQTLPAGTKFHVSFDYKADIDTGTDNYGVDTQSHNEPSEYIHYQCIGNIFPSTYWQRFSEDVVVPAASRPPVEPRMIMNHTFQVALLTPLTPIMGEGGVRSAT